MYLTRSVAERVPDRRAAAVFVYRALDLVGRRSRAPQEVLWKVQACASLYCRWSTARAAIYGVLGEDRGELLPPHAVLEGERAHHHVDLALVHTPEKLSVLREHRLGEQDVAHEQLDLPLGSERERFVVRVLISKQLLKRCHDVSYAGVS